MRAVLLLLIAALSIIAVACGSSDAGSSTSRPLPPTNGEYQRVLEQPRGDVATPDFTLRATTGETVRLSNYLGKQPVAVIFYRGFF